MPNFSEAGAATNCANDCRTSVRANVKSVKAALLEGLATTAEVAEALDVSERTVLRLSLPFVKIGAARYYDVVACRSRLLERKLGAHQLPRRGRPKKGA